MKLKVTLLALGVTLLSAGQSAASLLTASDILRIRFTTNPFVPWNPADPPDALGVNLYGLPLVSGFDLTGSTTKLFDHGVLLGTDTRIGTESIDIAPYFSYVGAETGQAIPAPTLVNFASILDGSIDGQIDFQLFSGSMLVIFDPFLLQLIDVTGPSSSTSLSLWLIQDAEIVSAPAAVPEPTTLLLLFTGLFTARQMRRKLTSRRAGPA